MIIMKFGGTSVRDAAAMQNVQQIILGRLAEKPVVVVSAMAGVTDLLEDALNSAIDQNTDQVNQIFTKIEQLHIRTAKQLFSDPVLFQKIQAEIHTELKKLRTLLNATQAIKVHSEDLVHAILSAGELLSSLLLYHSMQNSGIKTGLFDARQIMITKKELGEVLPDLQMIEKKTAQILQPLLEKNDIIITQGFIAESDEGAPSTLGRNGSDHSASLIGAALHASEIQIWTDVDGILTADPTIIPHARLLKSMTFEEACELAYFGARVLHPASIQPALEKGIPVRVLNSHTPDEPGTLVLTGKQGQEDKEIKSIVYKEGITLLTIESSHLLLSPKIMGIFFRHLADHGKRVYLVSKSATKLTLTVESRKDLSHLLNKIDHIGHVHIETNKAIVSIVGEGIKKNRQVSWKIIKMLDEAGIELELISQVASQISFMFIIDEKNITKTVKLLHANFIEQQDEGILA